MVKRNKVKKSEYIILILAVLLIIVLFFVFSFNDKEIKKSPQIKQELNSEKQTIEGSLVMVVTEDFENWKSTITYYLNTGQGEFIKITSGNKEVLVNLVNGGNYRITGILKSNELVVSISDDIVLLQMPRQIEFEPIGEQRVAAILVNLQNEAPYHPFSPQFIDGIYFSDPYSTNSFYREQSYDKTWLNGDAFGWYALSNSICEFNNIMYRTIEAANDDVNFLNYNHLTIIVGSTSCFEASSTFQMYVETPDGFTTLSVQIISSAGGWIPDLNNSIVFVLGHELGHGMNLYHANGWECGSKILESPINYYWQEGYFPCGQIIENEYNDPYDIMGRRLFHMNVQNKEKMGWLDANQIQEIQTNGVYEIQALETNGGIKTLKIKSEINSDESEWFYLEHRRPIGFDNNINRYIQNYNVDQGVLVHHESYDFWYDTSRLLDMKPNQEFMDIYDSALLIGESFTDQITGTMITPVRLTQDGIQVEVIYGLMKNPSFEIDIGVNHYLYYWLEDDDIAFNSKPDGYVTTSNGILDSNIRYQGSKSLKIQVTNNRGYSYQDIPVEYNKRYRVSGYVKTDCNDNNCYGTIISECENINHQPIWDYNNCKLNINPINIRRLYNDNDWTYIEFDVENNRQDARFLRVLCYNTPGPLPVGSGIVWCDSFNVMEIPRSGGVGSPLFLKDVVQRIGD